MTGVSGRVSLCSDTDVERNCEEVGAISWSSRRETGTVISCVTRVLLFGRLFPPASVTPSALLFSFYKQVLCLLALHKHPTHAWFLGSEGEYRQTLKVFSTPHERSPDHPCRDPTWVGEGEKNNNHPFESEEKVLQQWKSSAGCHEEFLAGSAVTSCSTGAG